MAFQQIDVPSPATMDFAEFVRDAVVQQTFHAVSPRGGDGATFTVNANGRIFQVVVSEVAA